MVVGGYQLDLYCEHEEAGVKHPFGYLPHSFIGQTYGECVKTARSIGWRISHDRQKAYCPICNKGIQPSSKICL